MLMEKKRPPHCFTASVSTSTSIALAMVLAAGGPMQAGVLTWDGNGATTPNPNGGAGTWNTSNSNWWDGTTNVSWPGSGTDNDAVFANTGGIVTMGTVTANDLTFNSSGYSLSSGANLTLNGTTPTITVASGIGVTFNTPVSGSSGLYKAGAGNLTLASSTNSWTNGTFIKEGTLIIGTGNNRLPTGTTVTLGGTGTTGTLQLGASGTGRNQTLAGLLTTGNGGSVTNSGTSTLTLDIASGTNNFDGALANTLNLTKTGNGNLTLSGTNTSTGTTAINAGTLQYAKPASLYNSNAANWVPSKITVESGATLALNVGGGSDFTSANVDTLLDNSHLGNSTATTGLKSGAVLGFDTSNGDFVYGSAIANPAAGANTLNLTKTGANTLTLSNTSSYTGNTTVSGGKLVINGNISTSTLTTVQSGASLGGTGTVGALTIDAGGTLAPGNSAGNMNIAGNLTLAGTFAWELAALSTANPGSDFDTLTVITGSVDLTGAIIALNLGLNTPSAIPFWQTDQTWSGILNNSGAGTLIGAFSPINNSAWATLGAFSTTYTGNDANLVWTAVPEPRAALLGSLGLLALLCRRR
jgi:autotransporter-associated beta strand protein